MFKSTQALEKGLQSSYLRNEVIANNIANVETPGFKSSRVEFESVFKEALEKESSFVAKRTRGKHISFGVSDLENLSPRVVEDSSTSIRMDGNNVDIDFENVELAKNTVLYNTLVKKISTEYSKIKSAIEGR